MKHRSLPPVPKHRRRIDGNERNEAAYRERTRMLVLTRKHDQEIVIGDPEKPLGTISVVRIERGKVRLGLTFPLVIEVHTAEHAARIVRERQDAAKGVSKP